LKPSKGKMEAITMQNYIRVALLASMLGISESTVWRWASEGKLPKPTKLSKRVTVWREDEVKEAIERLSGVSV